MMCEPYAQHCIAMLPIELSYGDRHNDHPPFQTYLLIFQGYILTVTTTEDMLMDIKLDM